MQTRGPLMIEHRLIERMLSIIKNALENIESKKKVDLSKDDSQEIQGSG